MSVTELSFAAALQRLGDIRRDLQDVADPDVVDSLEQEANALAEHCRALLRRPRTARAPKLHSLPEDQPPARKPANPPAESEDHLFDQFASSPSVEPLRDDEATVSIPAEPPTPAPLDDSEAPTEQVGTAQASDASSREDDAPTQALDAPKRTITLPGDAPTTLPPSEQDDAPTTTLHRQP